MGSGWSAAGYDPPASIARLRANGSGDPTAQARAQGGGMKQMSRLLRYVRPYWVPLLASVFLMGCVGAAQAMIALLIGPVIDRVLNPASAEAPVLLVTLPVIGKQIYSGLPGAVHDSQCLDHGGLWRFSLVFFIKGVSEYLGTYLVNYVGLSAITNLRQRVFEKMRAAGRAVLRVCTRPEN